VLGYLQVTTWVYQRSPKSIPGETLYDLQIFVGYLGCSQQLSIGNQAEVLRSAA
jgi:hypothetical protein